LFVVGELEGLVIEVTLDGSAQRSAIINRSAFGLTFRRRQAGLGKRGERNWGFY
jgi:hypothetical protein